MHYYYYGYYLKGLFPIAFRHPGEGRPEVLEDEEWWLRHRLEHRPPLEEPCTKKRRAWLRVRFRFWRR
jgi:hypothetical protein